LCFSFSCFVFLTKYVLLHILRIIIFSIETYGQVSVIGTVSAVGSQWETGQTAHASQLLEALSFGTTRHRSGLQVAQMLQDWGGTRFANTGREQALHCVDVLRPNVHKAMGLLAECLLEPVFDPIEVDEAKQALQYQALDLPPELWLGEALQMASFGLHQPLGQVHFCPPNMELPHLTAATVEEYWHESFTRNPHQLVVAGAGVRHETMVELSQQYFGHLQQSSILHDPTKNKPISTYQGGQCNFPHKSEDDFVRIGLVWPACGWHGDDLVATCVLQTLLGGGSSFSAGGPGKGMYSRLYRQVLNRYTWAESAEAITAFYNDVGLWGITGSCDPRKAGDLTQVLAEHAHRVAFTPVSDEELDRARNMLKNNVLSQLESRLVLFEDLGRQVLTYGKREDMHTTCKRIDSITKDDLMRVAQKALQQPPSIAAVGEHLDFVPRHDEIVRWFQ
jgi:processing peptidase subunit alpha